MSEIRTAVHTSGSCCRSEVRRCRLSWDGKAPPLWYVRKTDEPPCIIPTQVGGERYLLFFDRVPNVLGETFADFSVFYSFLSNGQFRPKAYTGKHSAEGIFVTPPALNDFRPVHF